MTLRFPRIFFGTLIILTMLSVLAACNTVTQGSGNVRTEERVVTGVQQVVLNDVGELTIIMGEAETLTIEADDNILPLLEVDVNNDTLTVGVKRGTTIAPTVLNYTLTVPLLKAITLRGSGNAAGSITTGEDLKVVLEGSGNVNFETVTISNLFELSTNGSGSFSVGALSAAKFYGTGGGSGDIMLSGEVAEQEVYLKGSGDYDADDLISRIARIDLDGSGNADVHVTDQLNASVDGSGSVNYTGEPEVEASINGSGQVNRRS